MTSDTSLQYDWQTGNTTNTSLIGIDYTRQRHETERYNRTVSSLDLFDPVYGSGELGEPVPFAWSSKQRNEQVGLYAQNQMKIADKWVLLLGGRQDWTESETSPYFGSTEWSRETDNAFTGRVGESILPITVWRLLSATASRLSPLVARTVMAIGLIPREESSMSWVFAFSRMAGIRCSPPPLMS